MFKVKKAVVLLSGGLDSATALFWARHKGYKCFCLIFNYGQRHKKEINRARLIAEKARSEYKILNINLGAAGSSLVNKNIRLAKNVRKETIPLTYVPARNIIFLSFAAAFAEAKNARAIIIGTNQVDYSNYPDCRKNFLAAFEKAVNKGTRTGLSVDKFKIIAPLQDKSKAQIVKTAVNLGVPLELTWSCYRGGKYPCNLCPSCRIRARGFKEAKVEDSANRRYS